MHASEHTEAVRFMRAANLHKGLHPAIEWLHHIPNGGLRHKTVAAKLKGEGVKPGVYDYFLPTARKGYHGLYIELKRMDGEESKEQDKFGEFVTAQGYLAVTCRGWEEAYRALCDYLGIRALYASGSSSP